MISGKILKFREAPAPLSPPPRGLLYRCALIDNVFPYYKMGEVSFSIPIITYYDKT